MSSIGLFIGKNGSQVKTDSQDKTGIFAPAYQKVTERAFSFQLLRTGAGNEDLEVGRGFPRPPAGPRRWRDRRESVGPRVHLPRLVPGRAARQ